MSKGNEIALTAQIDQLRTALREVLRLRDSRGLGVACGTCGARANRSCFDEGPLSKPHEGRLESVDIEVRRILVAALGLQDTEEKRRPG